MACREALLEALTQTHRALMAYSRCLDVLEDEEERDRFEQVCVDLATQAKTLQDHLLGYALYWGRGDTMRSCNRRLKITMRLGNKLWW